MATVASPAAGSPAPVPQSRTMTSKEWVIPPRPKPGRKPATDTPPTKRKAQNRAAQRAFRERRAARVGELEEQIEAQKAAHERTVKELREPTTGGSGTTSNSSAAVPRLGLSLSCADAYKTLSSHRHFDRAADDIGSWLPKLKALPVPRPQPGPAGGRGLGRDGRAPIEVEAASIMSVLKDFDVRFGRGE
ncbi:30cf1118-da73-4909-86a1-d81a5c66912c [Thermothielavioides terrestris]|uniref:30cf1118-da73-4909-86a1-d81a5c66912c n=1 Tax=Thermothielavioides terrestris TaxID=2587410 RepID=A0A3S5CWN6_9PEZI|nr:30cf1118-da73-4909-86a1-d81a5c66912c [Thermothielavioides terrestris]